MLYCRVPITSTHTDGRRNFADNSKAFSFSPDGPAESMAGLSPLSADPHQHLSADASMGEGLRLMRVGVVLSSFH